MTDPAPQGTPAPELSQPAAPTPAAPVVQPVAPASNTTAQTTIDPARLANLEAIETHYSGMRPLVTQMVNAGVKTPEDVASLVEAQKLQGVMGQHNITAEGLGSMFAGDVQPVQPAAITMDDIKNIVQDGFTSYDDTQVRNSETAAHADLGNAEIAGLEKVSSNILGQNANPGMKQYVEFLVGDAAEKARHALYPADHSLYTESFMPLTAAETAQIEAGVRQTLAGLNGSNLVAQAQAAQATMNGPAGTNGLESPNPSLGDTKAKRMSHDERVAAMRANMDQLQAQQQAGLVPQAMTQ